MSEQIIFSGNNLTEADIYKELLPQIHLLVTPGEPVITSLANISAALKQSFPKISWAGFYILKENTLWLGPFQGKIACSSIAIGRGVCGTSAKNRKTEIVPDIENFPGHIACDDGSRSEIVVPVFRGSKLYGVLDLDSYFYHAFNEIDQKYLEELCDFINKEVLTRTSGSIN
ncbi:MAG: GAF domain-containing protein [Ignavibacteriaceae bacterium]|nr:GAF domain-containing protein [Ignavibacteriaceae bacterium]